MRESKNWCCNEAREKAEAARLDGFETCEGLVAEMLEAMAEAEDTKAAELRAESAEAWRQYQEALKGRETDLVDPWRRWCGAVAGEEHRRSRAGALREAALAVRLGQARAVGREEA